MAAPTVSADRAADLHLHTCYSDGTLTPAELAREASARGLSTIAVTDHDTLASFSEAQAAAREQGLELLPGIELSAQAGPNDVHLLAYLFDVEDPDLRRWLTEMQAARRRRLDAMLERLRRLGIALSLEDVLAVAGPGTVGRLHVARALAQRGVVHHANVAFDKYLGEGKPAYVADDKPTPAEVIRRVRAARGVPVLAHPMYLKDDTLITAFARDGLAGLEVFHSSHDVSTQLRYRRLAEQERLLMTGGSDCHGLAKGQMLVGSVKLPYTYVEQLKTWHAQTYG